MTTRLKVMISSRCVDEVPFSDGTLKLSEFRACLKEHLQDFKLGAGLGLFEVWINEDAAPAPGTEDSWVHCLKQAEDCDLFVCIYNEKAGWAKDGADIGICHGELQEALRAGRAKVRLVKVPAPTTDKDDAAAVTRNKRFGKFIENENLFRGGTVTSAKDATTRVVEALHDSLVFLAQRGLVSARSDKFDRGEALEWNRLSFGDRSVAIKTALGEALGGRAGASRRDGGSVQCRISKADVLLVPQAASGLFTVAEVKAEVGMPHLQDHKHNAALLKCAAVGPVHMFACHRSVTEKQALGVLGFPDAVTVVSSFGVYVADAVQKSQLVFLKECRDDTSLRHRVQLFFDWLDASGEGDLLVGRATGRQKVVAAIAAIHEGVA
jgi:hypothetical protein